MAREQVTGPMAITIAPGKTDVSLHPQQLRVLLSPANEILYGGAAGPGKSFLVRALAIRFCYEIPGFHAGLFRRTFRELQDTHMQGPGSFYELLSEGINRGVARIIKNEIRFANGSRISLNHCQLETDVHSYQGTEFHLLAIDELVHFTERMYAYLRTRVRLGGLVIPERYKGKLPLIVNTSNPGGIGHEWVRKAFMPELPYVIRQMTPGEGGGKRQFIPARLADNPDTEKNDPTYKDKLRASGDSATARALLEGDWDVVADSMFGEVWQRDLHVIPSIDIPYGWDLWRGADDGYKAPACCLWFARDPIHKRTFVIKELYAAGMLPEVFAQRVKEGDQSIVIKHVAGEREANPHSLTGMIDPSTFADTGSGAPARGNSMNALGCNWKPADKYPGSRVHGVQHIHRMLAVQDDGLPKLQVFSNCVNLARALPTAPRDRNNAEDTDPEFELDHPLDALRYGLQWKDTTFKLVRMSGI